MSVALLTPPAEEPVSLSEAKLAVRVAHGGEDDFIRMLIGAAREAVEAHTGLALVSRRVRERRDCWRADTPYTALLALAPVSQIEAVRVSDSFGVRQTLSADSYRLDGLGTMARLHFAAGLPIPATSFDGLEVEYTCGFGAAEAVPAALKEAVLMMVSALYDNRAGAVPLPEAALALLAPYQRVRL